MEKDAFKAKKNMKRKRKEVCPSPTLEESPKRVKVQAQRKFAQNSGIHNGIITPIQELDSTSLPHTSIMPEPVELLPMKRPNTEDFLTFLCFRGTPILPTNLQFFNTASIVSDGQVHEIKGESSPRNGPIDIAKCAGSSEKPFIAFGVRKRADPIVISKQMERKRRHALAIQALRRKYQEQKMAKIRALTISKLSEKTTNKTLVKTNTIQKTETVTKKTQNTLQKTKVIATKHVKVTTRTLKTSVKPKMCLRSFRGKFVQKELPFRAIRSLAEGKVIKKRPEIKERTSRNSNKSVESTKPAETSLKKATKPLHITKSIPSKSASKLNISASLKRKHIKRRILIPSTIVATIVKPKLRSTTTKKTVISRRKAQQRLRSKNNRMEVSDTKEATGRQSNDQSKKETTKKSPPEKSNPKKPTEQVKKPLNPSDSSRRLTRRDSELTEKNNAASDSNKKEIIKNVDMKRQVKIAENDAKKVISKKLKLKKEFNLKSNTKEVNKKLDLQKTRDTTLEKRLSGQKITRDIKTVEMSIKKIVTRKSDADKDKVSSKEQKSDNQKTTNPKVKCSDESSIKEEPLSTADSKKPPKKSTKVKEEPTKNLDNSKKNTKITKVTQKKEELLTVEAKEDKVEASTDASDLKVETIKKKVQKQPLNEPIQKEEMQNTEGITRRVTRETSGKSALKEPPKKANDRFKKDFSPVGRDKDQDFSKKINEIISNVLKDANLDLEGDLSSKNKNEPQKSLKSTTVQSIDPKIAEPPLKTLSTSKHPEKVELAAAKSVDHKKPLENKPSEPKKGEITIVNEVVKQPLELKDETISNEQPKKIAKEPENTKSDKVKPEITTSKKLITSPKKDENPRRTRRSEASLQTSARPSRKTKEAAALYMEILSHKLVGDGIVDDDNISIDSFPELPNVKRTEQREIELKAQAKTGGQVEDKKDLSKAEESKNVAKPSPTSTPEKTKHAVQTNLKNKDDVDVKSSSLGKRKSNPLTVASDDDSDNEVLQAKIRKSDSKKDEPNANVEKEPVTEEENSVRRQTRRSTQQNVNSGSGDSSDESFHLDIRVPRKKKITRSKNKPVTAVSVLEKNVDIILEAARVLEGEKPITSVEVIEAHIETVAVPEVTEKPKPPKKKYKGYEIIEESYSDESTTSDINLKSLQVKQRNKKLSKTKCSKSSKAEFSDSDEEPLVKLTVKTTLYQQESKRKGKAKKTANKTGQEAAIEPKPKRECTKRPSNYLPMFSSSDEDDEPYFHGFNTKEETIKPKVFVQSLAPSLDLLTKDIGRKGKVNMSNEQIEQWLKDSALAGSSVAKENDEMLKFGEKIPAEVPKLENFMPHPEIKTEPIQEDESFKALEQQPCTSKAASVDEKPLKAEMRSPLGDRKWIFKKDKKELAPNKNAFSPENECSVYAFGEETEEIISTPFRRPSRRPSSTATSRSEDEMTKNEEAGKQGQFRKPSLSDLEDSRCFNIPQNPTKISKPSKSDTMVPPSGFHPKRQPKTSTDKVPEPFDDYKYKVPSSPSASSGSSAKLYKKGAQKQKGKLWEPINPVYVSDFPKPTDPAKLVEAPVFHPTEQEFQDPLEYIERIRHKAEQFGICKIVPPSSFKPECKVSDDMRFTAFNQYVHKMLHRWGPNFKEFIAIRKYLATQSISLKTPPLIGGMEIDLPRLYQTVQSLGGLKDVIEKKKWSKVSDHMKIPKSAQDRVTKLDDIYCKYLLPYDTLSPAEREKLFDEVETCWAKRESRNLQEKLDPKISEESIETTGFDSDDNELDECTMKGKNMALNALYRIARNTMAVYFKSEPTALEAEQEFWRYVTQKQNHICVHSASIDCGTWGYGFAVSKNSPFARHPWNLKVLSNNSSSVLRSLGPVMGVTIPTLHVGMVFSACCWYRDPHGLPWVEYLHTGGNKIWYGIPSSSCEVFHAAMQKLVPSYCRDKELWLPSDTAMVPPGMLLEHNVSLCRTIQEPGQFIVVFPKVFTSSISTGYVVSESVYFAPLHWLKTAKNLFTDLKNSCEPSMFSLDKLFVCIANDTRSSVEALRVILPFVEDLVSKETENRRRLREFSEIEEEKINTVDPPTKKKKIQSVDGDFECEICRTNLYVSMVIDTHDDLIYCLEDALKLIESNTKTVKNFKLKYSLNEEELHDIPKKINYMIDAKIQKKVPGKFIGLPTLLK
ncbi:uncharacterized protein LOC126739349 [Anthonomus grandis grandis]|uniref:uncharacterized protein LOC126739349 n=1 Tax=Anthonomus grandis grandis TaxID=2921223 RepID=UPI00216599C6|nr:uncharacterized protein LOC126739349 [Anthonomus grandis grandis]